MKWDHPRTIPAKFGLIWVKGFREEDLNVIFYQNMPNLHNRYKSAKRKISQKNLEYMLNYHGHVAVVKLEYMLNYHGHVAAVKISSF